MEIKDFIIAKVEEVSIKISKLENDLQNIYLRKSEISSDMDRLRESIIDKQSEALFRPQELGETFQLDEMMKEYNSFDDKISDIKKQLINDKDELGMFQKVLNYIRVTEKKDEKKDNHDALSDSSEGYVPKKVVNDKDKVIRTDSRQKNMDLFMQLHGLKGNLNFAKKICLSDTRRCMMEIDKISRQIDNILSGLN